MAQQRYKTAVFTLGLGLALLPLHAQANGLVGTKVTGSLNFGPSQTNGYDAANGFVPSSGYLNSGGNTTVTIASPAVEFGFDDSYNTDIANFSASQFTIEDVVASTYPTSGVVNSPFKMTFTDSAFAGLSLTKVSDSFPQGGLTATLTGSTVTIVWAGGMVQADDDYTSTFVLAAVPEPSTWAAVGTGAGMLALVLRRRRAS